MTDTFYQFMMNWFYGLRHLAEVGAAEIETYIPVTPELKKRVVILLTDYLEGKLTFEVAREEILKLTGREEPILKVKEIMNLPETPLPPVSDLNDTSPMSCRRKTHTWSTAEDLRLIGGVARYGLDNWQAVAHFLGSSRNRAQCSQRWVRCLDPNISKKPWSPEEDARLLQIVKEHGEKSWTKVAALLGGRSDVQCRYHYKHLCSSNDSIKLDSCIPFKSKQIAFSTNDLLTNPVPQFPALSQSDHSENQHSAPSDKPFNPRVHPPSNLNLNEGKHFSSLPFLGNFTLNPLHSPYTCYVGSDPHSLDLFLSQFIHHS